MTLTTNQRSSEFDRAFGSVVVVRQKLRTRLLPILCSPQAQALALIAGTLIVYRYAFFDVARADQLIYLYRTADIHSLWDLTLGAYDFNRTHSVGDFVLFRPILYMLLGLERWLWGYDFPAWQATSIALHISVVLSLFYYFRYVCRQSVPPDAESFAPFILALFFAFLYAGTELVAWHHIVGYLLFCLLAVQALFAHQRFLDRRDGLDAALIVLFAGLACFTYELGNVLACVLGLSLLATVVLESWTKQALPAGTGNRRGSIAAAVVLLMLPAIYVAWSYLDYVAKVGPITYGPPLPTLHLIRLTAESISSWTVSILVPHSLPLWIGGRITARIAHPPLVTAGLSCTALACATILFFKRRTPLSLMRNGLPALIMALVALAFALIISIGRGLQQSEIYVLEKNTYYAYLFGLFFLTAFFHVAAAPIVGERRPIMIRIRGLMLATIGAVTIIAGLQIYRLHEAMYRYYSGPIGGLVRKIETLEAQHGGEADFSFSLAPECGSIYLIPWFAGQALEKHRQYTIATALFPHEERDAGGEYTVHCL